MRRSFPHKVIRSPRITRKTLPSANGPDCFTVHTYTLLRRRYSACDTRLAILGRKYSVSGPRTARLRSSSALACELRVTFEFGVYVVPPMTTGGERNRSALASLPAGTV